MPLPATPAVENTEGYVPDITQNWVVRGRNPDIVIGQKDSYNCLYWWNDLEGWFNTSGLDTPITPRGTSDRAIAASRFPRKERYITIHGVCHIPRHEDNFHARDRLIAAWDSPNEEFDLIVEEPIPKKMRVRTVGAIDVTWNQTTTLSFEFSIPLVGLNPYKQGLSVISGSTGPTQNNSPGFTFPITFPLVFEGLEAAAGALQMYNAGTADSYPLITIEGPTSSGWEVSNDTTGKSVSFDLDINEGQTLVIDTERQTLKINNYPVQARRIGDWPVLQPGANSIRYTAPVDGASSILTMTANPAYK